jgi:hypothetical protein
MSKAIDDIIEKWLDSNLSVCKNLEFWYNDIVEEENNKPIAIYKDLLQKGRYVITDDGDQKLLYEDDYGFSVSVYKQKSTQKYIVIESEIDDRWTFTVDRPTKVFDCIMDICRKRKRYGKVHEFYVELTKKMSPENWNKLHIYLGTYSHEEDAAILLKHLQACC